jgi:hypothetical protein
MRNERFVTRYVSAKYRDKVGTRFRLKNFANQTSKQTASQVAIDQADRLMAPEISRETVTLSRTFNIAFRR